MIMYYAFVDISKRKFLKLSGQSSVMLILYACSGGSGIASNNISKLKWNGALLKDPNALFDLPQGFSYKIIMSSGNKMSDGIPYGRNPDGMGAFALNDGSVALVVNHETENTDKNLNQATAYDESRGVPFSGGTSTIILDPDGQNVKTAHRSLTGTIDNCAGGSTPWNTWISCEETYDDNHGYAFEVDPQEGSLQGFKRLTNMGRFRREAVAIDLNDAKGTVYQTEDDYSGLFYKFIPAKKEDLGGKGDLYALKIPGFKSTKNINGAIPVGAAYKVEWVPIKDPMATNQKTKQQGKQLGASIFSGGEGIICTNNANAQSEIFFTCKSGGPAKLGQMWKYSPSTESISLFYESTSSEDFWNGDNINITPWGDLIICEDNKSNACRLIGCTPSGALYPLGKVAGNNSSEIAGICFSPDGKNMYLNIQQRGKTIVINGDWNKIKEYRDALDSQIIHHNI